MALADSQRQRSQTAAEQPCHGAVGPAVQHEPGPGRGQQSQAPFGSDVDPTPLRKRHRIAEAGEQLGDAAIESIDPTAEPARQVDALLERLDAFPDHEKLHQALEEACQVAAKAYAGMSAPPRAASRSRTVVAVEDAVEDATEDATDE
jgi:hypothetical protein